MLRIDLHGHKKHILPMSHRLNRGTEDRVGSGKSCTRGSVVTTTENRVFSRSLYSRQKGVSRGTIAFLDSTVKTVSYFISIVLCSGYSQAFLASCASPCRTFNKSIAARLHLMASSGTISEPWSSSWRNSN